MASDNPNVIENFAGSDNFISVIPITVDNHRTIPYLQYPVIRQGQSVLQAGVTPAQLPAKYMDSGTGPILSICFTVTGNSVSNVTPDDFRNHIFRPTLSIFPEALDSRVEELEWDSQDEEYSLWDVTKPNSGKYVNLQSGSQYIVTTKPLSATLLSEITTGNVFISLMPNTPLAKYEGLQLGIVSAAFKLKLKEVVV